MSMDSMLLALPSLLTFPEELQILKRGMLRLLMPIRILTQ